MELRQAWRQVQGQAREMLQRAVEGLLQAERDRRVQEAQERGEKVYRWGYTVRKCWTTLWGNLEQVRVPRLRGREEIGLVERYEAREWALRFCARWRWAAPEMVEKFQCELEEVLSFFNFPAQWRHRLRTTNLGEGWFKHLRRYLSRFPGCRNAEHSEQVLGCFLLAAESTHR